MFDKTVLKIIKKIKKSVNRSVGLGCECVSLWLWGIIIVVATSPTNPTQPKGILVILILGEFNSYI